MGGNLRLDQTGPGDTYVLFFDGTSGCKILPDRNATGKTDGRAIDLVGSELQFAKDYVTGWIFNSWLAGLPKLSSDPQPWQMPSFSMPGPWKRRTTSDTFLRATGKNPSTVIPVLKMRSCPPPPEVCYGSDLLRRDAGC
jgi:hypothetical protein